MRALPVAVTLTPPVFELVVQQRQTAQQHIEDHLIVAAEEWGVPVRPDVRFELATGQLRGQVIRVSVDGRECLVPAAVSARALAYASGTPEVPMVVDEATLTSPEDGAQSPEQLHEMLAWVCRAAVAGRPEALLPAGDVLGPVLAQGVSLAGASLDELKEEAQAFGVMPILDRLSARSVDLLIDPTYMEELTARDDSGELFAFMRRGLFVELGVIIPRMHVCLEPGLRSRGFAVRINSVTSVPHIGLAPGTIYVNDTPERLALLNASATLSMNPSTFQPGAILDAELNEELEAVGLTTWDPFGYYILALAAEFRAHAWALVSPGRVRAALDGLGLVFPADARSIPDPEVTSLLTPLLRGLVADRFSIRNLRRIVELVRRHTLAPELTNGLDLTSFVRGGLSDTIASAAARNTDVVVVYLLEHALERGLEGRSGADVDPVMAEELRNALHTEIRELPSTAQVPSILTSDSSRVGLRDVISSEFPAVRVLTYAEIPLHYNIQPVARISR